jgi:hypothetical protein
MKLNKYIKIKKPTATNSGFNELMKYNSHYYIEFTPLYQKLIGGMAFLFIMVITTCLN